MTKKTYNVWDDCPGIKLIPADVTLQGILACDAHIVHSFEANSLLEAHSIFNEWDHHIHLTTKTKRVLRCTALALTGIVGCCLLGLLIVY